MNTYTHITTYTYMYTYIYICVYVGIHTWLYVDALRLPARKACGSLKGVEFVRGGGARLFLDSPELVPEARQNASDFQGVAVKELTVRYHNREI